MIAMDRATQNEEIAHIERAVHELILIQETEPRPKTRRPRRRPAKRTAGTSSAPAKQPSERRVRLSEGGEWMAVETRP